MSNQDPRAALQHGVDEKLRELLDRHRQGIKDYKERRVPRPLQLDKTTADLMQLFDTYANQARVDENSQALADFEPEYLMLVNPRKQPHLTDVCKAHLRELSDRYMYHSKRIAELTTPQGTDREVV